MVRAPCLLEATTNYYSNGGLILQSEIDDGDVATGCAGRDEIAILVPIHFVNVTIRLVRLHQCAIL